MPYRTSNELPSNVKDHIPKHAQDIYKEAFNSAYDEYAKARDRRGDADREETAHRVAWAAVKKAGYTKDADGNWRIDHKG